MLIATAGHIDHGKTALVGALTGVETDRLPEEKARGISIDLGFAHWLPEGADEPIGFVDVPGHERFVRNMLAGLGGVRFALVVVAADDGVMPQTVEHVQILDLLGIERGAIVITKCEKADATTVAAVREQAKSLLAGTCLAGSPVFEVSARTGAGIDELALALRAEAARNFSSCAGAFRLAIDRCFTVSGTGTVATGTVLAGSLHVGEPLLLSPRGVQVRARGLQSAGRTVAQVRAGQRCAINLAGVEVADVHRGDWLLPEAFHAPTTRIEARVRVLPERSMALRHGASLHLHKGTEAIPARLLSRRQEPIEPGREKVVTLVLDRPTSAINGERFVLRDASGRELVGGGRVIDPFVPVRRRRDETRAAVTAALEMYDPQRSLSALLAIPGHEVETVWFERCFNLTGEDAQGFYVQAQAQVLGRTKPVVLAESRIAELRARVLDVLAAFHREQPDVGGIVQRVLRSKLAYPVSADVLAALLRNMADERDIAFSGSLVRLPGHSASFSAAEVALWRAMLALLEDQPPRTVTPADLAGKLHASEGAVRAMLYRRRINGDLWEVAEGQFMLRDYVAMLAASAAALAAQQEAGFTAAQFRDATGIGRNHVIRLLEFFDRIGVTARHGDSRMVQADYESIVGTAAAWWVPAGR